MEQFVNRELELDRINEAMQTLQGQERLLRTPIMEFYGVHGIGKTRLLRKAEEACQDNKITSIWSDGAHSLPWEALKEASAHLNAKKPVVLIFDSFEAISHDQLPNLETELGTLLEDRNLFVLLGSRNMYQFENTRSIARKLSAFHLQPFDSESSQVYLRDVGDNITSAARELIFEWAHGYPLAMDSMVETLLQERDLDITTHSGQLQLLAPVMRKVVDQGLLEHIAPSEHQRYRTLLNLLAIPRRFNLVIMENLIKTFADAYKLPSSLAYVSLPNDINQATSALNWNLEVAGYCIDNPVRDLLLVEWKISQPDDFADINDYLAEMNRRFAYEVSGADRIRYLREYFYHLAYSKRRSTILQEVNRCLDDLVFANREAFLQFYEEFSRDTELKEALGDYRKDILSLMRRNFAQMYRRLAAETSDIQEKTRYLREFFIHTAHDPQSQDFPLILALGIRQIKQEESVDLAIKLLRELENDKDLRVILGDQYEKTIESISDELSSEEES